MQKPFLRWAGGKRWFIQNYHSLLPKKFDYYIEPFLGSGSVFFYLNPKKSYLGDSNKELIDTYKAIKKNWSHVYKILIDHNKNHSEEYYYIIRAYNPENLYEKAARLIYLNRTCWNGLYRVNNKGFFNVPIGSKSAALLNDDNFEEISNFLKNSKLYNKDFETLINKAKKEDFIFADPPYIVNHNQNGFVKYNEKIFSWQDQERLAISLIRAKNRGVHIICTNACHSSIKDLYKDNFKLIEVSRHSSISSKISTRQKFEELIISSL